MRITPMTEDEYRELQDAAMRHWHLIEWRWMDVPVYDPLIFGAYATKRRAVTWWHGELRYLDI